MKPKITYDYLINISYMLEKAVKSTLSLENSEIVFTGNEELLFLDALFKRRPDSESTAPQANFKIKDLEDITYFSFFDIWKDEVAFRGEAKKRKSFQSRLISFAADILNFIRKIRHAFLLEKKLKQSNSIIHIYSHLRNDKFIVPNLTNIFFKPSIYQKNKKLRKSLYTNLLSEGIDEELSKYLSSLFPLSHLELFLEFKNHRISRIKIDKVASTIYGILEDPLMSFLIKNSLPKLIYVQHGGGYGLNHKRIMYEIEERGSDEMYFWGTGNKNVFPTRFKSKGFRKINDKSFFILSERKNSSQNEVSRYIDLATDINNSIRSNLSVIAYPNADFQLDSEILRYGISYPEHEMAKLNIYDSIRQSLIYARILTKRPFLIIDDISIDVNTENGEKYVNLLRSTEILIPKEETSELIKLWLSKPKESFEKDFIHQSKDLLDHVLNQPKLNDLV